VRALALLLLTVLVLAPSAAQTERFAAATAYPMPYGYLHVFHDEPIGQVVGVYIGSTYREWRADTTATGALAYSQVLEQVLTTGGRVSLRAATPEYPVDVVAVDVPGEHDILATTKNGVFYLSRYDIYYVDAPSDGYTTIIIDPPVINLDRHVTYILSVADPNAWVTVESGSARIQMKISDLAGVDDSCIATVQSPSPAFPWTGGLLPSPVCTRNVKPLVTAEYNGQPLYPAFSVDVNGSASLVLVFSEVTVDTLEEVGYIVRVSKSPYLHVTQVQVDSFNVYFRYLGDNVVLHRVEKVSAVDATVVVNETRYCVPPVDAEVQLSLVWDPGRSLQGRMLPGELILYDAGGSVYMCRGDMEFLYTMPSVTIPTIREFREPLSVVAAAPTVLLLGNGKVYSGTRFTVPYEDYSANSVVVVTAEPFMLYVAPRSIAETPFFWLSIMLSVLFGALILQRPRNPTKTVRVVWDIATPPPLDFPSKDEVATTVKHYIDAYGVCPDDVDLALRRAILPWRGEKPTDSIIVCNFKTNHATERLLRDAVAHMLRGFWAFKRRGRSHGFAYTLVGDTMLVAYVYKQEDEERPEQVLLSALKKAMKTYIGIPLHRKTVGMIIVAEPRMARTLRRELMDAGVITGQYTLANLSGYLSVKFPELDEDERNRIVEFSRQVPMLLVVGDTLLPIVDHLGEVASVEYEAYLKRRGIKP